MPTLVQSAKADAASSTSQVITFGATPTNGNLLVALVFYSQFGGARTLTTPTGWVKEADFTSGNDSLAIFTRTAGASEPTTVTVAISGTADWHSGSVYEVSGSLSHSITTATSAASASMPASTGGLMLGIWGIDGALATPTASAGYAVSQSTTNANFHNHATTTKASGGVTEAPTISWGSTPLVALIRFNTSATAVHGVVSHEPVEALYTTTTTAKARVSHEPVEALYTTTTTAKARVSHEPVEVLIAVRAREPRNPTINHQNPAVL